MASTSDHAIREIYFDLLIVLAPLCTLAVALRFLACRKSGRKYGLEDWFALCALIVYLAHTIVSAINLAAGRGRDQLLLIFEDPELSERIRKTTYASLPLFPLQMLFSKLSIMALYLRIFGVRPLYRRWVYFIGVIHVVWVITIIVVQSVSCSPVEKFWKPLEPGWCFNEATLVIPSECVNSGIDFALVALALVMIRSIQVTKATKWRLGSLFGLGSFIGIVGFIKMGLQYSPDKLYLYTALGLWATLQMAVAIICCSAPVYKPILPSADFWTRLKSKASSLRLPRTSRDNSMGSEDMSPNTTTIQQAHHGNQSQVWVSLQEPNTSALAWPATTQWSEFHAQSDFYYPAHEPKPAIPLGNIHIQRDVHVV